LFRQLEKQFGHIVAFLKTLPQDSQPAGAEITSFAQVDNPKLLDENYKTINAMMKTSGNPYGYSRNLGSR